MVKLQRPRPKVGVITAAGVVFLAVLFLLRINPDRKFSGSASEPQHVAVADVVAGNVAAERYVSVDAEAEPLISQAVRATAAKGSLGLRVVPVRGTGAKLWLVLPGDAWEAPQLKGYVGRLRKLGDLPFAGAANEYTSEHPQPVFAAPSAVRAGLSSGQVATVTGETVAVHDTDRVAFDVVDPSSALIVASLGDKLATTAAWSEALVAAGIATHGTPQETNDGVVRFEAAGDVATLAAKLAKAELLAARVEPVTHHLETTWAELRTSSPSGFLSHGQVTPDAELDLVGLYVPRGIPDGAYALITGETPADYWYVLPVTIVVGLIALLFAWALVRAIKRDLLPTAPRAA